MLPAVKTAANQLYSPLTWNEHDAKTTNNHDGCWLHQERGPYHVLHAQQKDKPLRTALLLEGTTGFNWWKMHSTRLEKLSATFIFSPAQHTRPLPSPSVTSPTHGLALHRTGRWPAASPTQASVLIENKVLPKYVQANYHPAQFPHSAFKLQILCTSGGILSRQTFTVLQKKSSINLLLYLNSDISRSLLQQFMPQM